MRILLLVLILSAPLHADDRWYLSEIEASPGCSDGKSTCQYKPKPLAYVASGVATAATCSFPTTFRDQLLLGRGAKTDITPKNTVVLCVVTAKDHSALLADPELTPMPVAADAAPVKDLPQKEKDAANAALTKAGIADKSILTNGKTQGELIDVVGKKLDPVFDKSKLVPKVTK